MAAEDAIREHLPSLWRFDAGAQGLLPDLVRETGRGLSLARVDAANTMQAHWGRFADYAPISPFVSAFREDAGLPALLPSDPEVETHPYLFDLARLAGVLGLVPYTEPSSARETVEQFRRRVLGTVALWRNGVSTRSAISSASRLALSGTPDRAVGVEEFAPATPLSADIQTRGVPDRMVGPLMRWQVNSNSLLPVNPEIYIDGVAPVGDTIDATENPLIERFDPDTGTGSGLLYDGTVEPGQTLALRPSFSSWLGSDTGLRRAESVPTDMPANPTAPGPWAPDAAGPTGRVVDLAQGADGALWAAVNDAGAGQLWSFDATGWSELLSGLPELHCVFPDGQSLLIGHASGLGRLPLFSATAALTPDPGSDPQPSVRQLDRAADGTIWAATETGAALITQDGTLTQIGPGTRAETETPLTAVLAEPDGIITFGGDLGLFRFDTTTNAWHVYTGHSIDETIPDWRPWDPVNDALPDASDVFLPPVTTLLRGPDTLLWIGTTRGLAAWGAHAIRRTYATRLRAFPALLDADIYDMAQDARGRIWAATERGLIVYDGRDWFEENASGLSRLAPIPPEDPGSGWRFDRAGDRWQFMGTTGSGFAPQTPDAITTDANAVTAIFWTDGAVAQLGIRKDGVFEPDPGATPATLRSRIKPSADQIVETGIAAIPRMTPGRSDWRYLREEQADPPTPRQTPAWTREGRLLTPPDDRAAPFEGRFLRDEEKIGYEHVFAFNPCAKVDFVWRPHAPFSITVRLDRPDPEETLPSAVLDRVFKAAERVRPAGARLRLAFGETFVRGDQNA